MVATDYESTLAAALRLIAAGPFFILDLWERLPAAMQKELVEALATCRSVGDAVGDSSALAGLVEDQVSEEFDDRLDDWLTDHGLDRETIEDHAERPPATRSANGERGTAARDRRTVGPRARGDQPT